MLVATKWETPVGDRTAMGDDAEEWCLECCEHTFKQGAPGDKSVVRTARRIAVTLNVMKTIGPERDMIEFPLRLQAVTWNRTLAVVPGNKIAIVLRDVNEHMSPLGLQCSRSPPTARRKE